MFRLYFVLLLCFLRIDSLQAGEFNSIDGMEIKDISDEQTEFDPGLLKQLQNNNYISPNERNPHFYATILSDNIGTLISVGTFRSLIVFSLGKFDRLIMLDIAAPILCFNREHLAFIKELSEKFKGLIETQRDEYKKQYITYLDKLEKSDTKYYWEDNEKWEKIVKYIQEGKIHVVRGNLASAQSNQNLIVVLKRINDRITIDLSNVEQYINEKQKLWKGLEAFAVATPNKNITILATKSNFGKQKQKYDVFSVGEDDISCKDDSVDWNYYYFLFMSYYKNYLYNEDVTKVEIGESELLPKIAEILVAGFMRHMVKDIVASKVVEQLLSPYLLSENSRKEIVRKVYQKIFTDEFTKRLIHVEESDDYMKDMDNEMSVLVKDNLDYTVKNGKLRPGVLGSYFGS